MADQERRTTRRAFLLNTALSIGGALGAVGGIWGVAESTRNQHEQEQMRLRRLSETLRFRVDVTEELQSSFFGFKGEITDDSSTFFTDQEPISRGYDGHFRHIVTGAIRLKEGFYLNYHDYTFVQPKSFSVIDRYSQDK